MRAAVFCSFVLALAAASLAAERVTGANATLDIVAGAKSAALGGTVLAQESDLLGLNINSWQLAREDYAWVNFSHVSYYEGTVYDVASVNFPIGDRYGLGVSFSRYGADDIPWIAEGEAIPEGSDYNTLSIADWVFSASFGMRLFRNLDLGVSLHGLYRELDQTGWGFRGDAGAKYYLPANFDVSAFVKGWTSSSAKWESGTFEYESPEAYLAASWHWPVPYFYGSFGAYWQSSGIFHHEARDLDWDGSERGGRLWEEPLDWLAGGRAGVEFVFDFGLSLRAGLSSFTTLESFTAGAGLVLAKFVSVDYAFESHPELSSVHRVSVSVSPWLFMKASKAESRRRPYARPKTAVEEPDELLDEEELQGEEGRGESAGEALVTSSREARASEVPEGAKEGTSGAQEAAPSTAPEENPEAAEGEALENAGTSGDASGEVLEDYYEAGGLQWEE